MGKQTDKLSRHRLKGLHVSSGFMCVRNVVFSLPPPCLFLPTIKKTDSKKGRKKSCSPEIKSNSRREKGTFFTIKSIHLTLKYSSLAVEYIRRFLSIQSLNEDLKLMKFVFYYSCFIEWKMKSPANGNFNQDCKWKARKARRCVSRLTSPKIL